MPELLPAKTSFAYRTRHASTKLPDHAFKALWFSGSHELPQAAVAEPIIIESVQTVRLPPTRNQLCSHAAAVAVEHNLPAPFFANLIQQESGFKSHAVSPAGAQGIAQFMPRVARAYGLDNPFDPFHSLAVSAKFLRELLGQFGNLGLAAAAYNAGPRRVQDWMARRGKLPEETRNYVRNITGQPAERWARVNAKMEETRLPSHARCPGIPVIEVKVPEAAPIKVAKNGAKGSKGSKASNVAEASGELPKLAAAKLAAAVPGKKVAIIGNGKIQIIAAERGAKSSKKSAPVALASKQPAKPAKGTVKVAAKSAAKSNDRPGGKRVKVAAAGR